jgi:hypothetical protein
MERALERPVFDVPQTRLKHMQQFTVLRAGHVGTAAPKVQRLHHAVHLAVVRSWLATSKVFLHQSLMLTRVWLNGAPSSRTKESIERRARAAVNTSGA